jgi:hypothetical protein
MWIVIPGTAIYRLAHTQIGSRLGVELTNILKDEGAENLPCQARTKTALASVQRVGRHNALLVGAWGMFAGADTEPIRPREDNLLAIWAGTGSTLWSLREHEIEAVLFRLLDLAHRLWGSQAIPRAWEFKKVNNIPSIFAADRQLTGTRVAYNARETSGRRLLEIGTLYTAYRGAGTLHTVDPAILDALPDELEPPLGVVPFEPEPASSEEGDLVIHRPEGENLHLFAMTYPAWMDSDGPLTRHQRRVISYQLTRPLRIHGPAGSGKTLVLILRTLRLLREAQESGQPCRVLFVANSTAMRATVRAAIEAIDDRLFLATTRTDTQFLDVETLHGWCIRELGTEIGLRYVLNQDPTVSREEQKQTLAEVTAAVFADKYENLSSFLSDDFKLMWERNPEEFLKQLGWEIAVRIKGCGFRPSDKDLQTYVRNPSPSFVGRRETPFDRRLIFHVFRAYDDRFSHRGLLDTDDLVLSMAARLKTSLWDRQRRTTGYDFVMVDEAHLFNENERRVLPYLTRGTTDFMPLVLTFDEAQSIGGRRGLGLEDIGIDKSDRRNLKYVHRCSPDIVALARYVRERGSLLFSEFGAQEAEAVMSDRELKRCHRPSVLLVSGPEVVVREAVQLCERLTSTNYPRVGVVCFQQTKIDEVVKQFALIGRPVHEIRMRGEVLAATPRPGYFVTLPELCGGLEFDAVVMLGVEEGLVPPAIDDLSPEAHLAFEEESHRELYTAITRARYFVCFICDENAGLSPIVQPALVRGLMVKARGINRMLEA